jgi:phosphoribosylformylglycinamidine cyclo-ligase
VAYVTPEAPQADAMVSAARACGHEAWIAGKVKKDGTRKAVTTPALGLEYAGSTLQVR